MERPEAYPITYGVLGLLAFMGPLSGYDVKRLFDTVLSPMWAAAHSQIYNELRRMKELGWVEMQREEQDTRPDRKVYNITHKGRESLAAWEGQPPEVLQLRDELLLKVFYGSFAPSEALAANLRASIAVHELRLLQYRTNTRFIPAHGVPVHGRTKSYPYGLEDEGDPYFRLVARFAVSFEETYVRWLYEALAYVEKGELP